MKKNGLKHVFFELTLNQLSIVLNFFLRNVGSFLFFAIKPGRFIGYVLFSYVPYILTPFVCICLVFGHRNLDKI